MAAGQPRDRNGRWTAGGSLHSGNSTGVVTGGGGKGRYARSTKVTRRGVGEKPTDRQALRSVGRYGTRKGSPMMGNRNIRYVSRTQSVLGPAGRPASAAGVRRTSPPKSGYVVGYTPRM